MDERRAEADRRVGGRRAVRRVRRRGARGVIDWALERFRPSASAISTAFQIDGMAILDMAWASTRRARLHASTPGGCRRRRYELIDRVRNHYPGLAARAASPDSAQLERLVAQHGPNLFYQSVEHRLLCCDVRKVQPLTRAPRAASTPGSPGLRRDQWATRTNIRKIEIDHDHGGIVKLNPLADWTEDEVWDYVRDNDVPYHPLYDQGYTSIGCAPCTRRDRAGRGGPRRPLVVGEERAEGVRHPLRDRDRRLRARAARDPRRRSP